jgi:gas vesicle protein
MSDTGKIFGALLTGVAAGVVLGVLVAPDKGSNTRQKIADSTSDLIDQLSGKIKEGKEALNNLKMRAEEKADEVKGKVYQKAEDMKERAQNEYNSAKGKAENMSKA